MPLEQLEIFIFSPDQFETESVPRNLSRAEVADFLRERIDRTTEFRAVRQAEKVIEYYDLQEICDHLKSLLQPRTTPPEDVLRSISLARSIALVGTPEDVDFATQQYARLIRAATTPAELHELVWLNDAVGANTHAEELRARISERLAVLGARGSDDYAAYVERRELEEVKDLRLLRSQKANALKPEIQGIADRVRRIQVEIEIYLTLSHGYLEYLQPWATRRLRREVWGDQPPQQTVYQDDLTRRIELAEAFYRMAGQSFAGVPPESLPALRVRCLHASAYFGKMLPLDDHAFIREHKGRQIDILSNEE